MKQLFLAFLASLLAACGGLISLPLPPRDAVRDFTLEARFALRIAEPGKPPENASGRLSWVRRRSDDRVLLSSPLGVGIAQIDMTPEQATLLTADGKSRTSTDPALLMQDATGLNLPMKRLPDWLLGRADAGSQIAHDGLQRPLRLTEDGWQIEYEYADENPEALPVLVSVNRGKSLELRLRIEEWRVAP